MAAAGGSARRSRRIDAGLAPGHRLQPAPARRRVPGHRRPGPDHGGPAAVHAAQLRPHGRGQHRRAAAGGRRTGVVPGPRRRRDRPRRRRPPHGAGPGNGAAADPAADPAVLHPRPSKRRWTGPPGYYAAEGITSFTEAGIGGGWIGHSPVELAAYQRAAAAGRLHARAQVMPVLDVLHPLGRAPGLDAGSARRRPGPGHGQRIWRATFLSLGPAKVFLDGSLMGETAAVSQDYCSHGHTDNTGNTGYFQAEPDAAPGTRSRPPMPRAGPSPPTPSATGPLTWPSTSSPAAPRKYGPRAVPNRIEHASMTRPEQLAAAGRRRHRRHTAGQLLPRRRGRHDRLARPGTARLGLPGGVVPGRRRDPRRQLRPARGRRQRAPRDAGLRGPAHRLRAPCSGTRTSG